MSSSGGTATHGCDVSFKNSIDGKLGIIADSIRENMLVICISGVVLLLAIALIWILVNNIISSVRTYNNFTRRTEPVVVISPTKDTPDDLISAKVGEMLSGMRHGDDYGPLPVADDKLAQDPISERDSIQQKVKEIKTVYADYNKELAKYSREVLKREPDDLIDERIISNDDDVYA
jgi:hypothetical protein